MMSFWSEVTIYHFFTPDYVSPFSVSLTAGRTISPVGHQMHSHQQSPATCRLWTVRVSLCVSPASSPALPQVERGTLDSAATGIATLTTYS